MNFMNRASNGMNNLGNNLPAGRQEKSIREKERQMLPFAVEFVKFFIAFSIIVAIALLTLHFASAAM